MRVAIIGSGHVGLVTAACLAKLGHDVLCVDSNPEVIELLKHGKVRFHEPGLADLVSRMVAEGRLLTAETIEEAVPLSEVVFICVSTPPKANGAADLSYIEAATRAIAASMNGYHIIVEKSTVPAKTGERVQKTLRMHAKPKVDFDVVSFPEFSREGHAIDDFLRPDRLVLDHEQLLDHAGRERRHANGRRSGLHPTGGFEQRGSLTLHRGVRGMHGNHPHGRGRNNEVVCRPRNQSDEP